MLPCLPANGTATAIVLGHDDSAEGSSIPIHAVSEVDAPQVGITLPAAASQVGPSLPAALNHWLNYVPMAANATVLEI